MRLIDADDLILTILTHDLCDIEQIDKDILNAPTIKAIPYEWITNWLTKQTIPATSYGIDYSAVELMINDWEKENE